MAFKYTEEENNNDKARMDFLRAKYGDKDGNLTAESYETMFLFGVKPPNMKKNPEDKIIRRKGG